MHDILLYDRRHTLSYLLKMRLLGSIGTHGFDRSAIGCDYEPIVWVTPSTVTRDSLLEFEKAVEAIPEITEAARMIGQPDYLLRIVCADAAGFESLYMDELANLPHVQTLTSQLAMKTVKRTTALPIEV